jgi:hypothetical protein
MSSVDTRIHSSPSDPKAPFQPTRPKSFISSPPSAHNLSSMTTKQRHALDFVVEVTVTVELSLSLPWRHGASHPDMRRFSSPRSAPSASPRRRLPPLERAARHRVERPPTRLCMQGSRVTQPPPSACQDCRLPPTVTRPPPHSPRLLLCRPIVPLPPSFGFWASSGATARGAGHRDQTGCRGEVFQIRSLPVPRVAVAILGIPPVPLLPVLGMAPAFPAMVSNGRLLTLRRHQMATGGRHMAFWLGEADAQEIPTPRRFGVAWATP